MVMFVGLQGRAGWRLPQAALAAVVALLPGCESIEQFYSTKLPVGTAVEWWHDLQGGVIAEERPPPPGVDDPYPSIGSVPPKPTPTDAATRRALTARLASERDMTERRAAQFPIETPQRAGAAPAVAPAATPGTVPAAAAAPAPAPAARARIEAATASPAPPAPPVPAAPPAPAAIQAAAAPTAPPRPKVPEAEAVPAAPGPPPAPIVSGPVPALPTTPPALPALAGIPATTTAPATPRPAPQVAVAFLPESAVLRPDSDAALRQLATRRGGGKMAVLGGGDSRSGSVDAQAAALPLAWRRARAMADVLVAAGVPASAMQVDAAALGRGGLVRLVD